MARAKILRLTPKELDLLRGILGFADPGQVDGGLLDDEAAKQRSANARVFLSLCNKAAGLSELARAQPMRSASEVSTMDIEEYKAAGGEECPVCKSTNITGRAPEFDTLSVWRIVECDDCNSAWREVFTLTSIEPNE